jgi:hypothetical protein
MGSDISLNTCAYGDMGLTREQTSDERFLFERNHAVGLLPLLCFRYYDLKIMMDEQESRYNFFPWMRYAVPIDLAIKQMNAGVKTLKKIFPGASKLDPYVDCFVEKIMRHKKEYLHMNCMLFLHDMDFDMLINHALMGIQYPSMKMYYTPDQIEQFNSWEKPAANGIMTWSGAIRRLTGLGCISNEYGDYDQEELFTPSDFGDESDFAILGFANWDDKWGQ